MAKLHGNNIKINPFTSLVETIAEKNIIIKRNEITKQIEIDGQPATEQCINSLYIRLKGLGCNASNQDFNIFINSDHIEAYNPLSDYFTSFDKVATTAGTIEALANCLYLDPAQEMPKDIAALFLTKWLIGVVAGIYGDWYNAIFLILVGPKGCGKTEFFRRLLPEGLRKYFVESKLDAGKDDEALATENLLMFIDEMDFLITRKDAAELRKFISSNHFSYRPPYAKKNIRAKRIASLCRASNEMQVITDTVNNRRLIPIVITGIDYDAYNAINKNDLFVEAYQLLKDDADWQLSPSEIKQLDEFTGINAVVELEVELLTKYYKPGQSKFVLTSEIVARIQLETELKINFKKISKALTESGFKRISKRINGSPRYVWSVDEIR